MIGVYNQQTLRLKGQGLIDILQPAEGGGPDLSRPRAITPCPFLLSHPEHQIKKRLWKARILNCKATPKSSSYYLQSRGKGKFIKQCLLKEKLGLYLSHARWKKLVLKIFSGKEILCDSDPFNSLMIICPRVIIRNTQNGRVGLYRTQNF